MRFRAFITSQLDAIVDEWGPPAPERSKASLGSGLFIVRGIADGHGGAIALGSSALAAEAA